MFVAAGRPGAIVALVRAAVAVELVHSATLVHDDVLDAAVLRRGRPTVVAAAGRAIATATGDLLFSRAFAELAGGGTPGGRCGSSRTRRPRSSRASCCSARTPGTAADDARALPAPLRAQDRAAVPRRLRAGRAGRRRRRRALLGEFGDRIGLAFQLLDDVLDVSGPAERTGKHRGTDLLDGTVTLPLIFARERDPELAELDLRAVRTPEQAEGVCDAIAATGALEIAREEALAMVADAKARPAGAAGGVPAGGAGAGGRRGRRPLHAGR